MKRRCGKLRLRNAPHNAGCSRLHHVAKGASRTRHSPSPRRCAMQSCPPAQQRAAVSRPAIPGGRSSPRVAHLVENIHLRTALKEQVHDGHVAAINRVDQRCIVHLQRTHVSHCEDPLALGGATLGVARWHIPRCPWPLYPPRCPTAVQRLPRGHSPQPKTTVCCRPVPAARLVASAQRCRRKRRGSGAGDAIVWCTSQPGERMCVQEASGGRVLPAPHAAHAPGR